MKRNLAQKIVQRHACDGRLPEPGQPLELEIGQTLTQDATGTLVMLEFESMGLPRVRTRLSAQYVDHNLIQEDHKNPDDHVFLRSACRKFGIHYSPPGNGISHPVHMERFGLPGETLLGSDSHTPAAGSLGMLAIGAGGMEVALAMAGEPYRLAMPRIFGVRLDGELPDWVSAKDVILELLRRHGVKGGVGCVMEYHGPGVQTLSAMDRHVIANMGAELGATSSVFPSDERVKTFLERQQRGESWTEWMADDGCAYDREDQVDLSELEPLIACPSSPGNVRPVADVEGEPIYQAYIGSSANPGYRDFAIAAAIVKGRRVPPAISLDINPSSRQILDSLAREGALSDLIQAGARFHQAGCNGCIGMGQAPATGRNSLRTVPRNFPGRSGAREDRVFLCSPETAAASALAGEIVDPRRLDIPHPGALEPASLVVQSDIVEAPPEDGSSVELVKGPNIETLPDFEPIGDELELPVALVAGDDVSTDEIMPAGARVLVFRSNIPAISDFVFEPIDDTFAKRAKQRGRKPFAIVGGENYGQGSSREHAAVAPRYLGLQAVLAKSFARIHKANLVNVGILPLTIGGEDAEAIDKDNRLRIRIDYDNREVQARNVSRQRDLTVSCELAPREWSLVKAGGVPNWVQERDGGWSS